MLSINNFRKRSPTYLSDISDERARIARELHDGIAQDLASVGYALDSEIGRSDVTADARKSLRSIRENVTLLSDTLRKEIFMLRSKVAPTPQESLEDSLSALGVLFTLEGSLPDSEVGLELFKVIQEISRNASAHGGATSLIVTITPSQISVHNDGRELSSSESEGFGLQGIAERLDIVGWQISPSSSFRRFEIVTDP